MSKKVRIHDLAKKYGMSGKDMASKLRDLGFSQAKSHMSALDEFEVLQAEGVLQAHGVPVVGEEDGGSDSDLQAGGLVLRRKKKKKAPEPEPEEDEAEDEPEPAPRVQEPVAEEAAPAPAEPVEASPEPPAADPAVRGEDTAPQPAPEPATAAGHAPGEENGTAAAAPQEAAAHEPRPEPASAEGDAPSEQPASAPSGTDAPARPESAAATAEQAPAPAEAEAPLEPAPAAQAPSQPASRSEQDEADAPRPAADRDVVVPAPREAAPREAAQAPSTGPEVRKRKKPAGPKGNVVGFIDPSKFQSAEPVRRKSESRRLQSRDDDAPDVRPTFTHDRGRMRGTGTGGGSRGALTAAQLRERESGRFRRHNRPVGPGGKGGRGGRSSGGSRRDNTDSPLAGTQVELQAPLTLSKLAEALKLKANVLLKTALQEGIGFLNINATLDEDTAVLLADAFDVELVVTQQVAAEEALLEDLKAKRSAVEDEELIVRPPCVAFLGHVDHGKTTLIDRIRSSRMAEGESGGITQHIGAYQVQTQLGHKVTIIDTPGHAAFTAMRARGARAVDIVVLVVAGDDGVKPHTEEALNHARAAGAPVVVAITKKDKPGYDASKTMQQLTALGLNPEEWGGETAMIQVSGMTGEGLEDLLERLFLEGELLELKAHPEGTASGVVLEAEKQQGKGIVAHLLVQDGTLRPGDVILAGEGYGKVRSIHDDRGEVIDSAGPSMPVEVTGLDALPGVGDSFHVVEKLAKAKEVALERERNNRAITMAEKRSPSADLAAILGKAPLTDRQQINLIVRADVQGSAEVIKHTLGEIDHPEIEVKLLNVGVGPITESDVDLAITSEATLFAFHVGVNGKARVAAERNGIDIVRFEVIYELLDHVRNMMEGVLAPEYVEEITGHVEIRRLFKSSRIGVIAGCYVLDGTISRDSKVRLLRDDQVVYTGSIASLRRESDDAKTVREGFECGVVLRDYRDIKEGDIIETYSMVEVKRTLEDTASS